MAERSGILDNPYLNALMRGPSYFADRAYRKDAQTRRDAYTAETAGLLGSAGTDVVRKPGGSHPGLMGSGDTIPQYDTNVGASGYLGGQMNREELDLRTSLAHARQFPNKNMGSNIYTQGQANVQSGLNNQNTVQGAWDRNMYNQQNLSADQRRAQRNTDRAFYTGQQNVDRAYYTDQMKQVNQNLEIGNQLISSLPRMGDTEVVDLNSMNATQDNQMLMAFAKVINPGEAVGVDEKGAIQGASWMPDFLMKGVAALEGGGEMPSTLRQQIFAQYTKALQMNQEKALQLQNMNRQSRDQFGGQQPYSPAGRDYGGMYTGGQVGNTRIGGGGNPNQPARVGNAATFKGNIPNLFE